VDEFPRDLAEFERRFATDAACRAYLLQLRWPDGFRCPRCGQAKAWPVRERGLMQCTACGRQTSVTAGTIFQDIRTPLPVWFRAMWAVTSQKTGISALGLQRELGLHSYKTAWSWLHKLRRAMVRPGRDRLTGQVEVDEAYIGGVHPGRGGRQTETKALVAVAVQVEARRRLGRIRLRRLLDASGPSLTGFVQDAIEPGSLVHTDGWIGYEPLRRHGYRHRITYLQGQAKSPSQLLPHVHQVVSLLKRWLLGTHHGGVTHEHLDYYLDEFTFRFNRRRSRSRGKLFFRLVQQAVAVDPAPYESLVKYARFPS
jgi:transposase-like protein/transcription elongation factor Elf1